MKKLRESRGLTQSQLSDFLGDSTPGTVSRWEKEVHEIPTWVEEKMINTTPVTLPLEVLMNLMELAATRKQDFSHLIGDAIRSYLKSHNPEADPAPEVPPTALNGQSH